MNKVIIFGLDHHNSLGLARVFGINGIKPYGVLKSCYESHKKDFCYRSKYWEKTWFVSDEKDGLRWIIKRFSGEKEKAVLIPSSDTAEEAVDASLDRLKEYFICPGIKGIKGSVLYLLNKKNQAEWSSSLGIKTAHTLQLDLTKDNDMDDIPFPCILKPVMSSDGKKKDIRKCESKPELVKCMEELKEKGYRRILLQEFLDKDFEMELFGCIPMHSKKIPYLLTKHIREWPKIGGTGSCHKFVMDKRLRGQAERILRLIREYGYVGNFDIELFVIDGEVYMNEVNFRNSGDVYACFANKVYYPFYWYLDAIGEEIDKRNMEYTDAKYAMNETTDFRNVICKSLRFREWFYYVKNCGDFALRFKGDNKPAVLRYRYYFLEAMKAFIKNGFG